MASETYIYKPDYSVHPGEYLEEVLEAREIKKKDLADRLGISVKHLSQIINKQAGLTSELALQLERTLGVSANIWNNMNADYSLFEARQKESDALNRKTDWINNFPIKDLQKLHFIPNVKDPEIIVEKLLEFFAIPNPDQWKYYQQKFASFRKSEAFKASIEHITAWLRAGEIMASQLRVLPFNREGFRSSLIEIRKLTLKKPVESEPQLRKHCADNGAALVFLPEFEKTHICGATRWLTPDKALIVMSMRYKTNDQFWFTFFHEAGHVLFHSKKEVYIDDPDGFVSSEEDEANVFAVKTLIPEAEYRNFIKKKNINKTDVAHFARCILIHPALVVGRLQHDKVIPHNRFNDFKEHFDLKL